jgi:hypothetical protein
MPLPILIGLAGLAAPTIHKLATTRRVSFTAKKKVKKPAKVGFTTKEGRKVSFRARKSVTQKVPVTFRAKRKKRSPAKR